MTRATLPPSLPPRGLQREIAAKYVGISATKFDQLVQEGRMPQPKRVDGRKVWDRHALDLAFDALPDECPGGGDRFDDGPASDWDEHLGIRN